MSDSENRSATNLILEHQAMNCHLHAEINRLRAALRKVLRLMEAGSTISSEVRVIRIIEEALGQEGWNKLSDITDWLNAEAETCRNEDLPVSEKRLKEAAEEIERLMIAVKSERDGLVHLQKDNDRLRAALQASEDVLFNLIEMYGDSGAGLVLNQVREALWRR